MTSKGIFLSLGSNLSHEGALPATLLQQAVGTLQENGVRLVVASSLYETPPFPVSDQPNYVNAVIEVSTKLTPEALLQVCLNVEAQYGRERSVRWGARTLDIDLLSYDDLILPDMATWQRTAKNNDSNAIMPALVLPHPRLHQRDFVLVPMLEIAANWRHPVYLKTIEDLTAEIRADDTAAKIKKLNLKLL